MQPTANAVSLHPDDNVCIAIRFLPAGCEINTAGGTVRLPEQIRLGHKIASRVIRSGERVVKYGQTIGFAMPTLSLGSGFIATMLCCAIFSWITRSRRRCLLLLSRLRIELLKGTVAATAESERGITLP